MKTSIVILQPENKRKIELKEIIEKLNQRFTTLEQFAQRLDIHCLDIAREMGCFYERKPNTESNEVTHGDGWVRVFDFTRPV